MKKNFSFNFKTLMLVGWMGFSLPFSAYAVENSTKSAPTVSSEGKKAEQAFLKHIENTAIQAVKDAIKNKTFNAQNPENPFTCEAGKKCTHKIYGRYSLVHQGTDWPMVAVVSSDGSDCHACSTAFSLLIFERDGSTPAITHSSFNFTRLGGFGVAPDNAVKVLSLNPENSVVQIEDGYTGQGVTQTLLTLYSLTDTGFQPVLNVVSSFNDGGSIDPQDDWKTTLTPILDKNDPALENAWPDLKLSIKGKRGKKSFKQQVIYHFDGTKYTSDKEPDFLKMQ